MAYIQGEGRHQATLFPAVPDDLVPEDHVCRVIGAFVGKLVMSELGFERADAPLPTNPRQEESCFCALCFLASSRSSLLVSS